MHKSGLRFTTLLLITASSLAFWGCGQAEYEDEYIDEYADEYEGDEEGVFVDEYAEGYEEYGEEYEYSEDGEYEDVNAEYGSAENMDAASYNFVSTLTDEGRIVSKNSDGYTVFYSGDFYGEKVNSFSDARNAVNSCLSTLCDNENIVLKEDLEVSNDTATVYTFKHMQGKRTVENSIIKVVTDPAGNVLGLTSSLKSGKISEEDLLEDEIEYSPEVDFFAGKIASTWSGTVKDVQNKSRDITVPVVTDSKTGKMYLADAERKIICVDYDNPGKVDNLIALQPSVGAYSDYVLLYYDLYINIFDFYVERGWQSPNGRGTPTVLMIDIGTDNTEIPPSMGAYVGCNNGFEVMELSARLPNEVDYSLVGHEFTHIVTGANYVGPYINEYGALNESISDIMGNLINMSVKNSSSSEWFKSSFEDTEPDGYSYKVWDAEYTPDVYWGNAGVNDNGNVHHNSGIVSSISYNLYKAGMSVEEQFKFWLMTDVALTPNTDFALLAEKMPWCLEIAGFTEYEGALLAAIDSCGLKNTAIPDSAPSGLALLRFTYPDISFCEKNEIYFTFTDLETGREKVTWPQKGTGEVASALYPGNYYLTAHIEDSDVYYLYYIDSWMEGTEDEVNEQALIDMYSNLELSEGDYYVLETEGLPGK